MLIEYVPFGDLLGYLRKSRGLSDTYYKDPDIKPHSNLTPQQLIKFAWEIADGMSYLSSIPVSDVTIIWVMSLENKAHIHYTSLIIDSWTPHSQGCCVIISAVSWFVKGCFPKEKSSLCWRLSIEIFQLVMCWLEKGKRAKWRTLEWPEMCKRTTFTKEKPGYELFKKTHDVLVSLGLCGWTCLAGVTA